jgi:hypothetical protein
MGRIRLYGHRWMQLFLLFGLNTLVSLVLGMAGFYLAFSYVEGLSRIEMLREGISFSGDDVSSDRALNYAIVGILVASALGSNYLNHITARFFTAFVLLISIIPMWRLFISIPSSFQLSESLDFSLLWFVPHVELTVFVLAIILTTVSIINIKQTLAETKD